MNAFTPEQTLPVFQLSRRSSDADCLSWHSRSHHSGCADEFGQCGHAMNCPMFKRWLRDDDPM